MAAHARPLWSQLPDGALKRQLLGEIAAQVQLPLPDLTALWGPPDKPAARAPDASSRAAADLTGASPARTPRGGRPWSGAPAARGLGARAMPASRADHAARILLGHMAAWDQFPAEDHAMLCQLPQPHGELFVWLEHELHERGAQPWGALREGLREHPSEDLAMRVMADAQLATVEDQQDSVQELRSLLQRMLVEHLKMQETLEIAASQTDPLALLRYRELQARRLALEAVIRARP